MKHQELHLTLDAATAQMLADLAHQGNTSIEAAALRLMTQAMHDEVEDAAWLARAVTREAQTTAWIEHSDVWK